MTNSAYSTKARKLFNQLREGPWRFRTVDLEASCKKGWRGDYATNSNAWGKPMLIWRRPNEEIGVSQEDCITRFTNWGQCYYYLLGVLEGEGLLPI